MITILIAGNNIQDNERSAGSIIDRPDHLRHLHPFRRRSASNSGRRAEQGLQRRYDRRDLRDPPEKS